MICNMMKATIAAAFCAVPLLASSVGTGIFIGSSMMTTAHPHLRHLEVLREPQCVGEMLTAGESLKRNEYLCTDKTMFGLGIDGVLVKREYNAEEDTWKLAWESSLNGRFGDRAAMQHDGNFVVYAATNEPLWSTRTNGNPGAKLVIPAVMDYYPESVEIRSENETEIWPSCWNCEYVCKGDELESTGRLDSQEHLCIDDYEGGPNSGHYHFGLDQFGDLGLWHEVFKIWSAGTSGGYGNYLEMQGDGNLVVYKYDGSSARWDSKTQGNPGAVLRFSPHSNMPVLTPGETGPSLWYLKGPTPMECRGNSLKPGQRLFQNQMICDSDGVFGLDVDGNLVKLIYLYYIDDTTWELSWQADQNGKPGHSVLLSRTAILSFTTKTGNLSGPVKPMGTLIPSFRFSALLMLSVM